MYVRPKSMSNVEIQPRPHEAEGLLEIQEGGQGDKKKKSSSRRGTNQENDVQGVRTDLEDDFWKNKSHAACACLAYSSYSDEQCYCQ